jgi:Sigma-70, region 4
MSLDVPVGDDTEVCLGDLVAAPAAKEEPEDLLTVPGLLAALPATERTVVVLRFFHDLNQDQIAVQLGCSQVQVSRLLRRAIGRMRPNSWTTPASPVPRHDQQPGGSSPAPATRLAWSRCLGRWGPDAGQRPRRPGGLSWPVSRGTGTVAANASIDGPVPDG